MRNDNKKVLDYLVVDKKVVSEYEVTIGYRFSKCFVNLEEVTISVDDDFYDAVESYTSNGLPNEKTKYFENSYSYDECREEVAKRVRKWEKKLNKYVTNFNKEAGWVKEG